RRGDTARDSERVNHQMAQRPVVRLVPTEMTDVRRPKGRGNDHRDNLTGADMRDEPYKKKVSAGKQLQDAGLRGQQIVKADAFATLHLRRYTTLSTVPNMCPFICHERFLPPVVFFLFTFLYVSFLPFAPVLTYP
uniref:hypothetical protein n=1 Tax=Salmonella enterica TaxID=28901 RepID=UPI00398C43A2